MAKQLTTAATHDIQYYTRTKKSTQRELFAQKQAKKK